MKGTVTRNNIPFPQLRCALNQGDLWTLDSRMRFLNLWWLLFCQMWFKRTQSPLQSFCFSGLLSCCELTGYWSWQGFCRTEASGSTKGPAWNVYSGFVDGGPSSLEKGRFNISLDLSAVRHTDLKEKCSKTKIGLFWVKRAYLGRRKGKGCRVSLEHLSPFGCYSWTWLLDPWHCSALLQRCPAASTAHPRRSPGLGGSSAAAVRGLSAYLSNWPLCQLPLKNGGEIRHSWMFRKRKRMYVFQSTLLRLTHAVPNKSSGIPGQKL